MRKCPTFAILLLVTLAAGCPSNSRTGFGDANLVDEPRVEETPEDDLAAIRYDTGDVNHWPKYQLPLHHTFDDIPEVPPEVVGPFSPDDIPDTSGED